MATTSMMLQYHEGLGLLLKSFGDTNSYNQSYVRVFYNTEYKKYIIHRHDAGEGGGWYTVMKGEDTLYGRCLSILAAETLYRMMNDEENEYPHIVEFISLCQQSVDNNIVTYAWDCIITNYNIHRYVMS